MYGNGQTERAYVNPPKATGPTLIGEATAGVSEAAQKAYKLASIVREFNDSIHGSEPETGTGVAGGLRASGENRATGLRSELSSLHEALSQLERQVERLQRI